MNDRSQSKTGNPARQAVGKTASGGRQDAAAAKPAKSAVGVRLDSEDLAFLSEVAPGQSHSEAIRAIIAKAREHSQRPRTADEAHARILEILGGAGELRTESGARSVVIEDIMREALLVVATAQVGPPSPGLEDARARRAYEALIVDRAFDFLETVLRHTLSEAAPAWDPGVVRDRLLAARKTLVASLAATSPDHLPRSSGASK